ncbi:MAG: hypothetical protein ACRC68_01410, partial [Clostridium sp.]
MKNKKIGKELMVTLGFMILLALTAIYDSAARGGEKFGRILLIVVTVWAVYFFCRVTFLRKSATMYYSIIVFIFLSMYLANVWDFYGIPNYDKYLHLGSGILIALIGYVYFLHLCGGEHIPQINPLAPVIFSIIFSIAAAGIWEIWEFSTDMIFGLSAQNGSLLDTMIDIICGTVMGIVTNIPFYLNIKGKKIKFVQTI